MRQDKVLSRESYGRGSLAVLVGTPHRPKLFPPRLLVGVVPFSAIIPWNFLDRSDIIIQEQCYLLSKAL